MRLRRSVGIGVGIWALAGCHRGEALHVKAAAPAKLDAGWTIAESRDHTVSIAVASGWRYGADSAGDDLSDMLKNMGSQSGPSLDIDGSLPKIIKRVDADAKAMETKWLAALEAKGIVLNVINNSRPIPGEQRTRYYVKVTHGKGTVLAQEAIDTERDHYPFHPKPTEVELPIGKAFRFFADDSLRDGMTLHQISYVIPNAADTYTLRLVTEEDGQIIKDIAAKVANSVRILVR